MSSETSSPWNSAPAVSASPKAVSPWAVSPFQTSNPFKSPEMSLSLIETEPEPDVVSLAVTKNLPTTTKPAFAFSAAFEPAKEAKEPVASSAWTMVPIVKTEETVSTSAWTSLTPGAAEQDKQETLYLVKDSIAPVVEEVVAEEMVTVEEEEPEMQTQDEGTTSAWTSVPVQKGATSSWTMAHVVKETAVVVKAGVAEEPAVVGVSAPVESTTEVPSLVVDEIVVPHKKEEEEPSCAAFTAWTTASVEEAASSAWTSFPVKDTVVPVVVKVEAVERLVAQKEVVEPLVETAVVEAEVESDPVEVEVESEVESDPVEVEVESDPVEEASVTTFSPWTAASVREKATSVEIVPPELAVETPEAAAEKPELVMTARKCIAALPMEEDGLPTSAWNLISGQEEVMTEAAPVKEEPIKQEVVKLDEAPIEEIGAIIEAEKVVFAPSSAWNATSVQEVKVDEIEKVKSIMEEKPVQEPSVVEEVTKEAPVAAVNKELMATDVVVKNGKVDKKAIANAFDGVASYKVDSVSKVKKVPAVEAVAAKSADDPEACGVCGVGGCSIQ